MEIIADWKKCRKKKYKTLNQALKAVAWMGVMFPDSPQSAYFCKNCRGYHLTKWEGLKPQKQLSPEYVKILKLKRLENLLDNIEK